MQKELAVKDPKTIGEEISHELGAKMIKDFQDAHPSEVCAFLIGREILDRILAQPGCVGIRFFNAINEKGEKTLVSVGIDSKSTLMTEYSCVTENGELKQENGIVADRSLGEDLTRWFRLAD